MRAIDWDEYGFTYLFDSSDEARAWINRLLDTHDDGVEIVCRVHDEVWSAERDDTLCPWCEGEWHPPYLTHLSMEKEWCCMPPGVWFSDLDDGDRG